MLGGWKVNKYLSQRSQSRREER